MGSEPRIRVSAVLQWRGRVLLCRHEKPGKEYWLLPGGGVNAGESLVDALQRELAEEIGIVGEEDELPVEGLVANLNLDMVGRNWKDTVSVIGKEHSDLGATLARVNAAHPELRMTAVDDLWPAENFYFRSDHYHFARRGVPILFFFNGTHEDYHRPSDHPDKIDAEKQARLTQLVFYLGLEVANAAGRPRWNPESYNQIVTEGGAGR